MRSITPQGRHQAVYRRVIRRLLILMLWTSLAAPIAPRARAQSAAPDAEARNKIAPWLVEHLETAGRDRFLVVLKDQADLTGPSQKPLPKEARGRLIYDALRTTAARSQGGLRAWLDARGVGYQPFYLVNMLLVTGDAALAYDLAARRDVARVEGNSRVNGVPPFLREGQEGRPASFLSPFPSFLSLSIEWNIARVRAPEVWGVGFRGEGIVVAGQDTGIDWDHPALKSHYRGWNGTVADHNYNWHDAIHGDLDPPNANSCGYDQVVPCDDYGHGTHTIGTVVGDDGGVNQIGMAPGAKWIGCRTMENGVGDLSTFVECYQFLLAPYPMGGDPFTQGDPARAPDIVNDSWDCLRCRGCELDSLRASVEALRAAGIMVVASAGNYGPGCASVIGPPGIYDASFSVGATDAVEQIVLISSRGPVTVDGSNRVKPDLSAPGYGIRSSIPGGGYEGGGNWVGSSMAAPHVTGAVALLWSAVPDLVGDLNMTEIILQNSAVPYTATQACNEPPGVVPNNTFGWGRLDVYAAVVGVLNPCPAGDLDANREVNEIDSQLITRYWHWDSSIPRRYDLNHDGRVDVADIQRVEAIRGQRCPRP